MAFDYKKEYKEFYMPKNKPGILTVPDMNYIVDVEFVPASDTDSAKRKNGGR